MSNFISVFKQSCAHLSCVRFYGGEFWKFIYYLKGKSQHKLVEILKIVRFGLFCQNRETHYLWGRVDMHAFTATQYGSVHVLKMLPVFSAAGE